MNLAYAPNRRFSATLLHTCVILSKSTHPFHPAHACCSDLYFCRFTDLRTASVPAFQPAETFYDMSNSMRTLLLFLLYIQVPTDHFWGCMGGFYEIMPPCRPLTGSKFTIVRVCLTFLEVRKFTTFCDRKGYMGLSSTCKRTKHKRRTHSWRLSDVILFIMLKTCKHDCRSCRFLTM